MIPFLVALGIYLLGFSLLTYACIFADSKKSPLAKLLTVTLPRVLFIRPLKYCFDEKTLQQVSTIFSEWSLVVLYQFIVTASWSVVFAILYPEISISSTVSSWPHKLIGVGIFLACIESWRRVFHSSPGYITLKTLHVYNHYPYDHVLFFPDSKCPTLGIEKVPRSKFDRFYSSENALDKGRHVPRFDHYCGWVKNNIGQENYRDFLGFIIIHWGMCLYGSIIVFKVLVGIVDRLNLFDATFINIETGEEVDQIDLFLVVQYLSMQYFPIVSLGVLLVAMSIMLGVFVTFHLYITSRGMTTNEFFKWRYVRRIYKSQSQLQRPRRFPRNMYDRGFLENWRDVLWPKSLYPPTMSPAIHHDSKPVAPQH